MTLQSEEPKDEGAPEMILRRVGVVRSEIKEPHPPAQSDGRAGQGRTERGDKQQAATSELVIDPQFDGILDGVENFSHLWVLFWMHRLPPERRDLVKVHPMGRNDLPLAGIFATRSPARPNPMGLTVVRLLERKGNILRVEGLDAIDGSPILDIKPYLPRRDAIPDAKAADQLSRQQDS